MNFKNLNFPNTVIENKLTSCYQSTCACIEKPYHTTQIFLIFYCLKILGMHFHEKENLHKICPTANVCFSFLDGKTRIIGTKIFYQTTYSLLLL